MFQKLTRTTLLAVVATSLLAGCVATDFSGLPGGQSERRAEILAQQGRNDEAAAMYIGLASAESGVSRDRLTLRLQPVRES